MDSFVERVFAYVQDEGDLLNAALACKAWYSILREDLTWRKMYYVRYEGTLKPSIVTNSWKKLYLEKLEKRKSLQETWKHVLSFKITANFGKPLCFQRDANMMILVTDLGVIRGRLEKGRFTKTIHYFDTTSGPVGTITFATFVNERLLISGPSGLGVLYQKDCEEFSDERSYEVVFRGLSGVEKITPCDAQRSVLVLSKVGDCTKVYKVQLKHKQSSLVLSANDVAAYSLVDEATLVCANKKGDVFINSMLIASLEAKVTSVRNMGRYVLAFTENECFVISDLAIRKITWKKHPLGVAFDESSVPFIVQTKQPAISEPLFNGEYQLVVREGKMYILDGVTGEALNSRVLAGPGDLCLLECSDSLLVFMHGRNLIFWGSDPTLFTHHHQKLGGERKRAPKKPNVVKVMNQQIEEVEEEEWEEGRLENLRERMNIDGLTEEEMVQYALLLSSIDDQ